MVKFLQTTFTFFEVDYAKYLKNVELPMEENYRNAVLDEAGRQIL